MEEQFLNEVFTPEFLKTDDGDLNTCKEVELPTCSTDQYEVPQTTATHKRKAPAKSKDANV